MQILAIPRRKINIAKGEISTVLKTLLKGDALQGKDITLFEKKFADYIGMKHVFTLSSGRAALRTIFKILNLPHGSEILIPAYTDESVPWAILEEKLKPVFLDVKKDTGNIDIKNLEPNINSNTRAIIATHIFGNMCDIENILNICIKHNIIVIEDCAHAPGTNLKGKKAGSFGRLSYFSFGSAKHFSAYGGGCLLTNDDILAEKIRNFLSYRKTVSLKYLIKEILSIWFVAVSCSRIIFTFVVWPVLLFYSVFTKDDVLIKIYNKILKKEHNKKLDIKKISNLQAKIALIKLELLERENNKRKENVSALRKNLIPKIKELEMEQKEGSNYCFYILKVMKKDNISRKLLQRGIDTGKFLMRNAAGLYNDTKLYPVTQLLHDCNLQIPIHSTLNKNDILRISKALNKCFNNYSY